MLKIVELRPLPGYSLHLRYADGVVGDVDLSHLVGKGVFRVWNDPQVFQHASLGSGGEVRWSDEVDLCADSLSLEITGKTPEQVFAHLRKAESQA